MDALDYAFGHDRRLLRVTVVCAISQPEGELVIMTARSLAALHGYALLYDVRQAIPSVEMESWFHLPRELSVFEDTPAVRVAILTREGVAEEAYRFYETVSQNLGFILRVFLDEAEALRWVSPRPVKTTTPTARS